MSAGEEFRIFVGHDPREQDAYDVCVRTLRAFSTIALDIRPLSMIDLAASGVYTRKTVRDAEGRLWDECAGKRTPMSTTFSLARFFVPYLCKYRGSALFVDCDFMFRADVSELARLASRPEYAVQVVKHCYYVRPGDKMDGQINEAYPRKNWSSLVIWNCSHSANLALTPKLINEARPSYLHGFRWLKDELIGDVPIEWNWIAVDPRAVHFTYGVPTMPGHENEPYADEWISHYRELRGDGRRTQSIAQDDTAQDDTEDQADT